MFHFLRKIYVVMRKLRHREILCIKEIFKNFMFVIGKFLVLKKYLEGLVLSCDKFESTIFIIM